MVASHPVSKIRFQAILPSEIYGSGVGNAPLPLCRALDGRQMTTLQTYSNITCKGCTTDDDGCPGSRLNRINECQSDDKQAMAKS